MSSNRPQDCGYPFGGIPLAPPNGPGFARLGGYPTTPLQLIVSETESADGFPVSGDVRLAGQAPGPTSTWDLYEVHGEDDPVESGGSIAGTVGAHWTPGDGDASPGALPSGPYRWRPKGAGGADMGGNLFVVYRDDPGAYIPTDNYAGDGRALGMRCGVGPRRISLQTNSEHNPANLWGSADDDVAALTPWINHDTARQRTLFGAFPYYSSGLGNAYDIDPAETGSVSATVARYAGDVDVWAPYNEPGVEAGPNPAQYPAYALKFGSRVLAGNPSAKVSLFDTVTVLGNMTKIDACLTASSDLLTLLRDHGEDSFHLYNSTWDLRSQRRSFQAIRDYQSRWGLGQRKCRFTEAPSMQAEEEGTGNYSTQTLATMTALHLIGWYGWQIEDAYLYQWRDTGNPFRAYMANEFGVPMPAVAAMIELSRQLRGCNPVREQTVDFGTIGNEFNSGVIHRRADGTGVLEILSTLPGPIPLEVTSEGTVPLSLTCRDYRGRILGAATVTGGLATLPSGGEADLLQRYVQLPAGVTAVPADTFMRWTDRSSATATAAWQSGTFGLGSPTKLLRGTALNKRADNGINNGDARSAIMSTVSPTPSVPESLVIDLQGTVTFDRILFSGLQSWQDMSSIVWATADVMVGGSWVTGVGEYQRQPNVLPAICGAQSGPNSFVEWLNLQATDGRIDLDAPVTATKVRLNFKQTTYGNLPTAEALTAYGQTTATGSALSLVGYREGGVETHRAALLRVIVADTQAPVATGSRRYVIRSTS